MPLLIGFLVVMAAMYQFFFRYETWENPKHPGVMYERDTLTGNIHELRPGAKTSVFARILGTSSSSDSRSDENYLEPLDEPMETRSDVSPNTMVTPHGQRIDLEDTQQVAKVARPVPVPREVVVASSAPPVPMSHSDMNANVALVDNPSFAVRQVDLDQDGSAEEIIQHAQQSDGLLDISIVKNGREIFYGRGKQLSLLPTHHRGWADIALKLGAAQSLQVFRYDAKEAAYKQLNSKT